MNEMNTDRALNWDDEFTNEQQEFVLLPEGDYAFEVTGMERARFEGSAKLPPCSMAKLTLKIFGGAKGRCHRHRPPVSAHQDPGPAGCFL